MPRIIKILILSIITALSVIISPFLVTFVLSVPPTTVEQKCGKFSESCHVLLERIQDWVEQGYLIAASKQLAEIQPILPDEFKLISGAISANIAFRSGRYGKAIALYTQLIEEEKLTGENRLSLLYNLTQAYLERADIYQKQGESINDRIVNLITVDRQKAIEQLREITFLASPGSTMAISATLKLAQLGETIEIQALSSAIFKYPQSLEKMEFLLNLAKLNGFDSRSLYLEALSIGEQINQPLASSWALGSFAEYLLSQGDYREAIKASIQAQLALQSNPDWILMARWQNVSALAFTQLGERDNAAKNYELAFFSVNKFRKDLAGTSISPELVDLIQKILRNYLAFLLEEPTQAHLLKATEILQLAGLTEIDRYFRSVCSVETQTEQKVSQNEAVIYTVILDKQFSVIAQLPDGSLTLASQSIDKQVLEGLIVDWRFQLSDKFEEKLKNNAKLLYNLIIEPISPILTKKNLKRLIFINDGMLKTVPMTALFDGVQYLVENYQISYRVGVKNSSHTTFPLSSVIVNGAPNLVGVSKEVAQIGLITAGKMFKAENIESLQEKLPKNPYDLLHLATHSEFSGLIEETTITIGNRVVSWTEFEEFLRALSNPLVYLNLSSCETAQGNEYATLGLAGLGLRTGIKTIFGSLWQINDLETVNFMKDFYLNWKATNDIDRALQLTQIQKINQNTQVQRPVYWAGFVILH